MTNAPAPESSPPPPVLLLRLTLGPSLLPGGEAGGRKNRNRAGEEQEQTERRTGAVDRKTGAVDRKTGAGGEKKRSKLRKNRRKPKEEQEQGERRTGARGKKNMSWWKEEQDERRI